MQPLPLITDEQFEILYGVSRKTLANWRVKGQGPNFVKIGAAVRYRPEDVEAWIKTRVFGSTAEYHGRVEKPARR